MHNIDITILGEQALAALMQRLSEARGKHPVFAEGKYHALGVIQRAVKPLPSGRGYKAHLNWNFCL